MVHRLVRFKHLARLLCLFNNQHRACYMPKERCKINGRIITKTLRDGYKCPDHTLLQENGGKWTAANLVNTYKNKGSYGACGGYCCSFCHGIREPINESTSSSARGSWIGAVLIAVVAAVVCSNYEIPVAVGLVGGAIAGYWFKPILKIAVIFAVIGIGIAILYAFFE